MDADGTSDQLDSARCALDIRAMRTAHIEKKSLSSQDATETLRRALTNRLHTPLTAADAAVASGLPLADAENALLQLSTIHPCRIGIADDGTISVRFQSLDDPTPTGFSAVVARTRAFVARHRDPLLAAFTLLLFPFVTLMGVIGAMALGIGAELRADDLGFIADVTLFIGGFAALGWMLVNLAIFAFFYGLSAPSACWRCRSASS